MLQYTTFSRLRVAPSCMTWFTIIQVNNGLGPQRLVCGHFQMNRVAKYIEIIGPLAQAFPIAGGLVTYWLLSCSLEITGESFSR